MNPSVVSSALVIELIILIYLGIRYNMLDEIWIEIPEYEEKVEKEFAQYLELNIFQPVIESLEDSLDNYMPDLHDEIEGDLGDIKDLDIQDNFDFKGDPAMSDFYGDIADQISRSYGEKIGSGDSFFSQMIVDEGELDPKEVLRESRNFKREYDRINNIYGGIQLMIIAYILFTLSALVLFLMNMLNSAQIAIKLSSAAFIFWIIFELRMWHLLQKKVEINERTIFGKFNYPELTDLFG